MRNICLLLPHGLRQSGQHQREQRDPAHGAPRRMQQLSIFAYIDLMEGADFASQARNARRLGSLADWGLTNASAPLAKGVLRQYEDIIA